MHPPWNRISTTLGCPGPFGHSIFLLSFRRWFSPLFLFLCFECASKDCASVPAVDFPVQLLALFCSFFFGGRTQGTWRTSWRLLAPQGLPQLYLYLNYNIDTLVVIIKKKIKKWRNFICLFKIKIRFSFSFVKVGFEIDLKINSNQIFFLRELSYLSNYIMMSVTLQKLMFAYCKWMYLS